MMSDGLALQIILVVLLVDVVLVVTSPPPDIQTTASSSTLSTSGPFAGLSEWRCNFDVDWCNFTLDPKADFIWGRAMGKLPHADTGPQFGDHSTGSGYYAYINASLPRKMGDLARLVSPTFSINTHCGVLSFWYYALGYNLGSLVVRTSPTLNSTSLYTNWSIIFRISGADQIRSWRRYQTNFITDTTFRLAWEGTVGNGYQSDYAIDDIEVKSATCPSALKLEKPPLGWGIIFNTSTYDPSAVSGFVAYFANDTSTTMAFRSLTTRPITKQDEFPAWAIALLVIGCFFIAATIFLLLVRYFRKRKSGSRQKYSVPPTQPNGGVSSISGSATPNSGSPTDTTIVAGSSRRHSLSSDNSLEMPTKKAINVAIENTRRPGLDPLVSEVGTGVTKSARNVRFQTEYETEYGFGMRLGSAPPGLTPVPKDVAKEADKVDKKAEKRKVARSKLSVRQRRRLRLAKLAELKAQQQRQGNAASGKPGTFSALPGIEFPNEPGRKKPAPLPPPHILNMLMKMRTTNNPMNNFTKSPSSGNLAESIGSSNGNSVVAVIEPHRASGLQHQHHHDLGIEDVSDDDFENDDYEDEGEDDDYEEDEDDEIEEVGNHSVGNSGHWDKSHLGNSSASTNYMIAPNERRNQVTVITHSAQQLANYQRSTSSTHSDNNHNSNSNNNNNNQTTKPSSTFSAVVTQHAPGLYDGLDDDEDEEVK